MKPEFLSTRNRATLAISSGVPSLPTGIFASMSVSMFCGIWSVISVLIYPGAIAFTVIFLPADSLANALVNPITPAFAAE